MVPDQSGQQVEGIRLNGEGGVFGAEIIGDLAGVWGFVKALIPRKADAERPDRFAGVLLHEGHDETAIQPTAEERTQRHVAEQADLNGLAQPFADLTGVFVDVPNGDRPRTRRRG